MCVCVCVCFPFYLSFSIFKWWFWLHVWGSAFILQATWRLCSENTFGYPMGFNLFEINLWLLKCLFHTVKYFFHDLIVAWMYLISLIFQFSFLYFGQTWRVGAFCEWPYAPMRGFSWSSNCYIWKGHPFPWSSSLHLKPPCRQVID